MVIGPSRSLSASWLEDSSFDALTTLRGSSRPTTDSSNKIRTRRQITFFIFYFDKRLLMVAECFTSISSNMSDRTCIELPTSVEGVSIESTGSAGPAITGWDSLSALFSSDTNCVCSTTPNPTDFDTRGVSLRSVAVVDADRRSAVSLKIG